MHTLLFRPQSSFLLAWLSSSCFLVQTYEIIVSFLKRFIFEISETEKADDDRPIKDVVSDRLQHDIVSIKVKEFLKIFYL